MRATTTDGGLKWGVSLAPNIMLDALNPPYGGHAQIAIEDVIAVAKSAIWVRLDGASVFGGGSGSIPAGKFWAWIGADDEHPCILRLIVRRDMNPLDAVFTLCDIEGEQIPRELVWALVAAVKTSAAVYDYAYKEDKGAGGVKDMLLLTAEFYHHFVEELDMAQLSWSKSARLSGRGIKEVAKVFISDMPSHGLYPEAMHVADLPLLMTATPDIYLAEDGVNVCATYSRENLLSISYGLDRVVDVVENLMGIPVDRDKRIVGSAGVREAVEWAVHHLSPAARRLFADFATDNSGWPAVEGVDENLCGGLTASLLREAQANQVYVPSGEFLVTVPPDFPIPFVTSLAISADADGIWCALVGDRDGKRVRSNAARFNVVPGPHPSYSVDPGGDALFRLVCAAFWRDLVVAGPEVIVQARSRPSGHKAAGQSGKPSTLVLPRKSYIHLNGKREWASHEEREAIKRTAHGVKGFRRNLPDGWTASDQAQANANDFGVVLPDGYTFVRPHIRGAADAEQSEARPTKARGLQALTVWLNK